MVSPVTPLFGCFVWVAWPLRKDDTHQTGLCTGPLPDHSWKPLNLQAALYALISQLTLCCNMQLNALDDLAEAMKALDGKKSFVLGCCVLFCLCGFVFGFCCRFLDCDDFVTDWTMYRSFTRSLLKPLNLQEAMYALIS